jgi:hypothetical protein
MATMARTIYWLVNRIHDFHERKLEAMSARGMNPIIFSDLPSLRAAFNEQRASTILVSDSGQPEVVRRNIDQLSSLPEFKGVRFILSVEANYLDIKKHAALWCFRDLLPIHEDTQLWMQRVNFASGAEAARFLSPRGMLSVNEICTLSVPARLVSISDTTMRIETPLKPNIGSTLTMPGAIAERLGCDQLMLRVQKRTNEQLNYRFSDSIVASWEAPAASIANVQSFLESLKSKREYFLPRAFVVLKSQALRAELLPVLEAQSFFVNSALHKANVENDPKFFSPDIVFIEDDLCSLEQGAYLRILSKNLEARVPIVIVGRRAELVQTPEDWQQRTIIRIPLMDGHFADRTRAIVEQSRNSIVNGKREDSLIPIDPVDAIGMNFVQFPGRIRGIHPLGIQVTHAFQVNNFSLCQINSPFLKKAIGKAPFIKLTDVYQGQVVGDEQFLYGSSAYLADLSPDDRGAVATNVSNLLDLLLDPYVAKTPTDKAPLHFDAVIDSSSSLAGDFPPKLDVDNSAEIKPSQTSPASNPALNRPKPVASKAREALVKYQIQDYPRSARSSAHVSSNADLGRAKVAVRPRPGKSFTPKEILFAVVFVGIMLGVVLAAAMLFEPDPQAAKTFSDPFIRMKQGTTESVQP